MSDEYWFLTTGEWRMGPLTPEDAIDVLRRPHDPGSVYAWRPGFDTWLRADQIPELSTTAAPAVPSPFGVPPVLGMPAMPATPFFVVGTGKLLLMFVATLGLYQIYWFFQHWRHVRASGEDVQPAVRTILTVVFCYPLFRRIADAAEAKAIAPIAPIPVTAVFLLLSFVAQFVPLPWALVSLLSVGPLMLVQRTASAVSLAEVPTADTNTRLSPLNWFGIAVGGLFLLLVLLGMLLPPPADRNAPADPKATKPSAIASAQVSVN